MKKKESVKNPNQKKNKFSDDFRARFAGSAVAEMICSFGSLQEKKQSSVFSLMFHKLFDRFNINNNIIRPMKYYVSKEIEQSMILDALNKLFNLLLSLPLGVYGIFLAVYTLSSQGFDTFVGYLTGNLVLNSFKLTVAGIFLLLSLVLIIGGKKRTMATAICESKIVSALLFDLLGFEKERFEKEHKAENGALFAVILGFILGLSTLVIDPMILLEVLSYALFLRGVFVSPESGFLVTLFMSAFCRTKTVGFLLILVLISYFVKLLRGKRNLKFSLFSGAMLVFAFVVWLSGFISASVDATYASFQVLSLLLGFFLARNLLCKREWVFRCAGMCALTTLMSAIVGSIQFLILQAPEKYTAYLNFHIPETGLAEFSAAGYFGVFLSVGLPVFVTRFFSEGTLRKKSISFLGLLVIVFGIVVSRSSDAWMVGIVALCLLAIFIKNSRIIPILIIAVISAVSYIFIVPKSVLSVVSAFAEGNLTDKNIIFKELHASAERLFMGIGAGSAQKGGNFYSHILTEFGLVGLLLVIFVILGILSYGLYSAYKSKNTSPKVKYYLCGFSASFLSLVFAGFQFDLLEEGKLFFMLSVMAGICLSSSKVLCKESELMYRTSELDRDLLLIPVFPKEKKKSKIKKSSEPK